MQGGEAPVEQSPTASTAEVSSQTLGARVTVASEVGKGGASTDPPVRGQQDDLYVADPPSTLGQHAAEVGDTTSRGRRQVHVYQNPCENDVVVDRSNVDDFKEASRTIAQTCLCDFCLLS